MVYFIDTEEKKSISSTPLKGLHKYSLNIHEIFLYNNVKWTFMENTPKSETQNGHTFNTTTVEYCYHKNSPVHKSKSKLCTRLFKNKPLKFWLILLSAHFVVPSNEIARIKSGHVEM